MDLLDITDFAQLLRAARGQRGWSQQRAAEAGGVSRRLVNQLEGGQHPNAELWRVLALLSALGVTLRADLADKVAGTSELAQTRDDIDLEAHQAAFRTRPRRA